MKNLSDNPLHSNNSHFSYPSSNYLLNNNIKYNRSIQINNRYREQESPPNKIYSNNLLYNSINNSNNNSNSNDNSPVTTKKHFIEYDFGNNIELPTYLNNSRIHNNKLVMNNSSFIDHEKIRINNEELKNKLHSPTTQSINNLNRLLDKKSKVFKDNVEKSIVYYKINDNLKAINNSTINAINKENNYNDHSRSLSTIPIAYNNKSNVGNSYRSQLIYNKLFPIKENLIIQPSIMPVNSAQLRNLNDYNINEADKEDLCNSIHYKSKDTLCYNPVTNKYLMNKGNLVSDSRWSKFKEK